MSKGSPPPDGRPRSALIIALGVLVIMAGVAMGLHARAPHLSAAFADRGGASVLIGVGAGMGALLLAFLARFVIGRPVSEDDDVDDRA